MSNSTKERLLQSLWFNQGALPLTNDPKKIAALKTQIEQGQLWADKYNISESDQKKAIAAAQNKKPFKGLLFDSI